MRLTVLLTIVSLFQIQANTYSQSKKISLDISNATVETVIHEIEARSEFKFLLNRKDVDIDRKVTIKVEREKISKILSQLFSNTDIDYEVFNKQIVLKRIGTKEKIFLPISPMEASPIAEMIQFRVSGNIVDQNGQPLPGASIVEKGTTNGTQTDFDGNFTIELQSGDVILMVSYVGFASREIAVNGRTSINIVLEESAAGLEEVVVVGYGTQRKKDLTGAVAVVDVQGLKQQPAASPIEGLQGKATGVQIINSGAPGATPQIRIRGFSTINNNDPLYVIDGMPYEGKLSWLSSNDIESMQVLKDASSASIYGARANNGVVIVTTRRGVQGKPRITLDTYSGMQVPNRGRFPEFLNPQQYGEYVYQQYINAGRTPGTPATTGSNYGSDPNRPTLPEYLLAGTVMGQNITAADADPSRYNYMMDPSQYYTIVKANQAGTNWFEEITHSAPIRNHQLSILGGSENATYAFSASAFKQDGTFRHTGFERYTVRSNTQFSFLDNRLTIGENMQYSATKGFGFGVNENTSGSYQGEGSPIGWAYRIQTIVPVYDIAGNFAGTKGDKMGNADNPLAVLYRSKDNVNHSNQFFGSGFADLEVLKGLNFRTTFGMRYESFNGKSVGYPNPERSEGSYTNNTLSEYQGYNREWTWSNVATYKTMFNETHNLTVLVGTEAVESKYHQLTGNGNDFFIAGDQNYYYLSTAGNTSSTSEGSNNSLFSIFGRLDYSFMDRYLFSATVRRDGSSNFGPDHRYGTFPAASVAWRLSEEEFMGSVSWLDDLKFRAGYGVTGNQRIPTFQFMRQYASGTNQSFYPITGGNNLSSGLWTSNYNNQDVKWEELKSVNLGLDFTIFDNTLDGSIDWFDRRTDGVLYPVPQPSAAVGTGSSPFINSGKIKNAGFEVGLNYHFNPYAEKGDFRFDVGAFFSKYNNDVLELAPTVTEQPYLTLRGVTTSVLKAGAPFGAFYGYEVAGIFQSDQDIANGPAYPDARVGGFKYADINNDGVIDGDDRTVIGNPHPDFIYSLSFGAEYKRFDINMFFNGSQGNQLFDLTRQYTDLFAFPGGVSTRTLKAWSPSNPNSTMPSPYADAPTFERQSSSYYVQDGSFFRMKNLQIGYTLPVERIFDGHVSNLRIYASATNLFTITKYTGMDPEVSQYSSTFSAPGVDMGVYPVPRQYLLGFSITF